VQILVLRKEFKWINLTQVLFSTLFGFFADFTKKLFGGVILPTYAGRLVLMAISIVLIGVGIAMYVNARLVNMPMEGMTAAITQKWKGKSFHQVKAVLDCVVVFFSAMLSLVAFGGLHGVREGTVLCAMLVGPLLKPIQKVLKPAMDKICF
jgi:uncharacterized membrane protein YczE